MALDSTGNGRESQAFYPKPPVCPKRYCFNQYQVLVQVGFHGTAIPLRNFASSFLRTLRLLLMGFTAKDAKNSQRTAE
jgi:hypothetical protein